MKLIKIEAKSFEDSSVLLFFLLVTCVNGKDRITDLFVELAVIIERHDLCNSYLSSILKLYERTAVCFVQEAIHFLLL